MTKISKLIKKLTTIQERYGDINVVADKRYIEGYTYPDQSVKLKSIRVISPKRDPQLKLDL